MSSLFLNDSFYHNFTRLFDIEKRRNCYTVNVDMTGGFCYYGMEIGT